MLTVVAGGEVAEAGMSVCGCCGADGELVMSLVVECLLKVALLEDGPVTL